MSSHCDRCGTASPSLISPTTAPNPKVQLRINTALDTRAQYLDPPPRYTESQIETVKTAPLLLHPPPRRAVSQDVNAMTPCRTVTPVERERTPLALPPMSPPPTGVVRPAHAGHARKFSDKFKAMFTHVRRVSEPEDVQAPLPPVSGTLPKPGRRVAHRRNESAPHGADNARIAQWISETAAQRNPPRPHRSPNTASFIVSANSHSEISFPRFDPTSISMNALHSQQQKDDTDTVDENDVIEPITAALYPAGKGLLGTTQRRAHLDDSLPGLHRLEVSHFSNPTTPASRVYTERLDVTEDRDVDSSSSSGGSSFDPTWYMHAR